MCTPGFARLATLGSPRADLRPEHVVREAIRDVAAATHVMKVPFTVRIAVDGEPPFVVTHLTFSRDS